MPAELQFTVTLSDSIVRHAAADAKAVSVAKADAEAKAAAEGLLRMPHSQPCIRNLPAFARSRGGTNALPAAFASVCGYTIASLAVNNPAFAGTTFVLLFFVITCQIVTVGCQEASTRATVAHASTVSILPASGAADIFGPSPLTLHVFAAQSRAIGSTF